MITPFCIFFWFIIHVRISVITLLFALSKLFKIKQTIESYFGQLFYFVYNKLVLETSKANLLKQILKLIWNIFNYKK